MSKITIACDHLDHAEQRLSMLSELLGGCSGELELTDSGVTGLFVFVSDVIALIREAEILIRSPEIQP